MHKKVLDKGKPDDVPAGIKGLKVSGILTVIFDILKANISRIDILS